ncbi:MAG: hypothetical protein Q8O57_13535, partial [Kiritimatiellota bacterium]|nr:hypothetical protein [Kiritimatiellota bacterium]
MRRPWAAMARTLGMTEAEVLHAARDLFERGVARRFGAVFDSRHLGYASTLCAVDVPLRDIERVAALLQPHPGITHCYEREGRPNLWFTLTAPADRLDDELRRITKVIKPYKPLNLPAIRHFKVQVILDAADDDVGPVRGAILPDAADGDIPPKFSAREKSLIRKIQGNLLVVKEPFASVAQELKWDPDDLLQRLASWKQAGILRRIGFILRHQAAGFVANGMCVWPVVAADVERAGRLLAGSPEVSHCYERPSSPAVPFNLYAMIHARERGAAEDIFRRLSARAALSGGRMLISLREFKKSSPLFFL